MNAGVKAYPWERLPRLELEAIGARRELLRRVFSALEPSRLAPALTELLGDDVRLEGTPFTERRRAASEPPPSGDALSVQFRSRGVRLTLRPEPDLCRACVARLLEQDFELGWADAGIDAALRGASAALVLELARRAAREDAPELPMDAAASSGGWVLEGRATLLLSAKPYRLDVSVEPLGSLRRATAGRLPARLAALGAIPLRVPWVAAVSSASVATVEGLEAGDVWLPGARAWVLGEPPLSAGLLAPPRAEWGLPVRVSGGRTVLGAEAVLVHEEGEPPEPESSMSQQESELSQIVGETPLVVRLELGALEMSAAEWAGLHPGDVIQTGRRLEDPVVLRAAGREIARGELVDIEGELGVRITSVTPPRAAP